MASRTARPTHRCTSCGAGAPSWLGRCPSCGSWGTVEAERAADASCGAAAPLVPLLAVPRPELDLVSTGVAELDRVLGGGLVPGSVTLVGGEPGVGKSTLLLQAADLVAHGRGPVLYVAAEESPAQVQRRAERLGASSPELWVAGETELAHVIAAIERLGPSVVVVDSIQAIAHAPLGAAPGSVTQVRECADRLGRAARATGSAVVLVGHVTKDGALAGPRTLEHLVDTVLAFDGDRQHALRFVRAVKHRFGSTAELGVLEMTDAGLVALSDPSRVFLADRRPGLPGSAVGATLEGRRPLLVEVQALVTAAAGPPRRVGHGVEAGHVALLLAVLATRAGVATAGLDVYVSAVAGVRLGEPGTDLAIVLAVASAAIGRPLAPGVAAIGEVGLGGEVRQVPGQERRVIEATRLGFDTVLVPGAAEVSAPGCRIVPVPDVAVALSVAGLT